MVREEFYALYVVASDDAATVDPQAWRVRASNSKAGGVWML
jgi:hypothetical protein